MAPPRVEPQVTALPEAEKAPERIESKDEDAITSPMVGTYYASPSPDDDPFVKVGDKVDENTVIGIIEAMKAGPRSKWAGWRCKSHLCQRY